MDEIDLSNAILFADGARGIYVPQHFAEAVNREYVKNVSDEDFDILASGPDHEHYWDAWADVLDNAELTIPETGKKAYLYQDGDLWIIPEED